jgi:Nucleotidyl transferase AbiEii toxin, Type IV TA system
MPKKPKPPIKNMGASVRGRLLNLSKQRRQPFELLLNNYVLERLLYRLSQTDYRDRFILKGAMLLTKWFEDPLRPTRDLDLLGIGNDDQDEMVRIFKEVSAVSYNDGVAFDPDSVKVERILLSNIGFRAFPLIAGAMIVRVPLLLKLADQGATAMPTLDQPGECKVSFGFEPALTRFASVKYPFHSLPKLT